MIWLMQDLGLLSVILRAITLSLEILAVGGVLFLWLDATPRRAEAPARSAVRRFAAWIALTLAVVQTLAVVGVSSTAMGKGSSFAAVSGEAFFKADCVLVGSALVLFFLLRFLRSALALPILASAVVVVSSSVLGHAVSQPHHRAVLLALMILHHLAAAAWIGAMPALLIAMRRISDAKRIHALAARFLIMAAVGIAVLALSGIGMASYYVASWQGLYGTQYGVMLMAKGYLLVLAVLLGIADFALVRRTRADAAPVLTRLRKFNEVEIGLIFTAVMAAAVMAALPPARAIPSQQATGTEIAQRMKWVTPLLRSPSFAELPHRSSLKTAIENQERTGGTDNGPMDRDWSEFNHHWAGIFVLVAGLLAFVAGFPRQRWAGNWPLLFIALAAFMVVRADAGAWPLGPRPFWASFAEPGILEHRLFALLIIIFAVFEWGIESGRLHSPRAALVFPGLCAVSAALLLTHHMHGFGSDLKNETMVSMTHVAIAVVGATAGWARWLQMRTLNRSSARWAAWLWPVCFMVVGILLLDYREA